METNGGTLQTWVMTKECSKCGKTKPLSSYYKTRANCKQCTSEYRKAYRKSELGKNTLKNYVQSGRRYKISLKHKDKSLERKNKYRESLDDQYVIHVLSRHSNIKASDMPKELIELKRKQLKLYRDVKNNIEENH